MKEIKKVRPGYAKGYNSVSRNKGRFVMTEAQLKKVQANENKKANS